MRFPSPPVIYPAPTVAYHVALHTPSRCQWLLSVSAVLARHEFESAVSHGPSIEQHLHSKVGAGCGC